ncbi:hypothetical protein [Cytophaga sp. FL35]|uniref:hypothetical protein n=1 Tax=Cytophaga sp. FL35 TaxID=1904456 RepID=UPI001653A28D|nr:hypothetical protein [Cytophaga sp. FL35]MBC7000906.1 hypothetical protein [Cytophaga sp. FL35]
MKKFFLVATILVFTITGCKNQQTDKVNLVYENGIEKIVVEIENGQDFLFYDQPTKTNFVVTNIDPIDLVIMGLGIRVLGTEDGTKMTTEINVPSNHLDKDTLTIKVRYGENYKTGHDFNIPLRNLK